MLLGYLLRITSKKQSEETQWTLCPVEMAKITSFSMVPLRQTQGNLIQISAGRLAGSSESVCLSSLPGNAEAHGNEWFTCHQQLKKKKKKENQQ